MQENETSNIIGLIKDYQEKINELIKKLETTNGKVDNKTSTTELPTYITIPPPAPLWLWLAFYVLVVVHVGIVLAFITSFFVLPVFAPWYIAVPCMTFIWFFSTTRVDCQLTNLENHMRRRLGMKRIGGFVGYYFLRPAKMLWGKRKRRKI